MSPTIELLFDDPDLCVINKPPGLHSSGTPSSREGSVAHWLDAHFPGVASASDKPEDAGLVHRLDRSTSGVLIAAKHRGAWDELRAQLLQGTWRKQYLIVVEGLCADRWEVENHIGSPYRRAKKVRCYPRPERRTLPAHTVFQRCYKHPSLALSVVRAETPTTRRHQVRAHAAHTGHPLLGDRLYGAERDVQELITPVADVEFLLHAALVEITHPRTGQQLTFRAPLSTPFRSLLRRMDCDLSHLEALV